MARAAKKQIDYTDILLYGGLFILLTIFLFQLLKLWNNGNNSLSNFFTSTIPQAAENTLAAIESALTGGVTNPLSSVDSIFSWIPSFFSLVWAFITDTLGSIIPGFGLASGVVSLLSPTASPADTGNGSSYSPTIAGTPVDIGGGYTITPGGDGSNAFSANVNAPNSGDGY